MKSYMFNKDEVVAASLEYFGGDSLAAEVFANKYALQDNDENYVESTPAAMHRRLACEFARIEAKYTNGMDEEEIFSLFDRFKYVVPQGSPMSAIGNNYKVQSTSNCFVIAPPADSYGGIMMTDEEEAQIMKRRGGVGFDLSTIRPKGQPTNNAANTTDGIGVFMERFSNTCREVAQGGRRGALMLSISVHHPEVLAFATIKRDKTKVTGANISIRLSDEFMEAVRNGTDYEVRWPVDAKKPKISKRIDAREVWTTIIESAHSSAEPGLLFWDTAKKYTPSDAYADVGFESVSTNPCFAGDTLLAVADGRNAISIKQLAEEGKDVPVYSVDKQGQISIKWGRNPRVTGYNQKLVRVGLDDGSHFDVTPNHVCLLRDGTRIEAKDLKNGDSLSRFNKFSQPIVKNGKDYLLVNCNTIDYHRNRVYDHRLIAKFFYEKEWNELYDSCQKSGWAKTGGITVHHKDHDGLNNSPNNLQVMTWRDHNKLHAEQDCAGENNGRFSGFSNEQVKEHAMSLTEKFGYRFSNQEWQTYAELNGLPKTFSKYRSDAFGSVLDLAYQCAEELGFENVDADPRLHKTLKDMLSQGYDAEIVENQVFVSRKCETCDSEYRVEHNQREVAFCSHKCSLVYVNSNKEVAAKRTASRNRFAEENGLKNRENQARIYSSLKFNLGADPMMKEWEKQCSIEGVPARLKTKYGFKSWDEVKEAGNNYNHKVVSVVELDGEHTVYNITVDDNHTVALVTKIDSNRLSYTGVNVANCGEIILSKYDSCRLLLMNLTGFVKNAFLPNAEFDFALFHEKTVKAQRLMDDMIDLELEMIEKIMIKIDVDPEADDIKEHEKNLWRKIKKACIDGRRTGLGVTALGDALAMLGVKYGTDQSVEVTGAIYKALAVASYSSSVILAAERGAFGVFSHANEDIHPFIQKVIASCSQEIQDLYHKVGRRNIANTTTAPAGSVSILTQTTSGIEPMFSPTAQSLAPITRRRKINPDDKDVKVDFVDDLGDSWTHYTVYHHGIMQWMNATGRTDVENSPYFGATSADVDWMKSVDLQAAAQAWVCHAISKTCNLPADASVDVVKDVYMRAWETGCKGFTVYRDGSRSGVLIAQEEKKVDKAVFEQRSAPKRPSEMPCSIHSKVKVKGETWTILIGLMDGKPYEVFGGLSKFIEIPKRLKAGRLIKNTKKKDGVSVYTLVCGEGEDEMIINDVVNVFEDQNYPAFTRTISLALRHGTPVQYLVEQLSKDKFSDMQSFSRVIARVLKDYIPDGTASSDKKCLDCGAENSIKYSEGCLMCTNCGSSKCG